jgi:cobalt-zinc-cadmium resistance protein CzcA
VTIYEGKSAEELERQVTVPTEIALAGMPGLERIDSISLYGLSDIKCKFSYGVPYRDARQEVINRLSNLTLPDNLQPSIIPNMVGEVMRYTLTGSANLMELRTIQDWTVARYLKTADGVEDVSSTGGYVKAYNVTVFPDNLIKYGITLSQVIDSLSRSNLNVGGRVIEMGDQYYMVRGLGLIKSLEDIENTLVAVKNSKPVLVKNIAQVSIGNVPRTGIVVLNDKDDIVMGDVTLRKDAQSMPSLRSIHEKINELNTRILPKRIKIVPYYDRWDLVISVVKKVIETAATGIALVTLALLIFLGNFRSAVITALVIPVSLLITLALMAFQGDSANLLSIGAIDFGIIVDIPLILVEDYFRLKRKYGPDSNPLVQAYEEVGRPILFSVVIILLAFIPIFMMKGAEAQIFSPMARTYLYAILFTVVLTFSYLVASKHLFLEGTQDNEWSFICSLKEFYLRIIGRLLNHRKLVLALVFVAVALGLFTGFKFIGSQFIPNMDEGNIYLRIIFPSSISLNKAYENSIKVKNLLLSLQEVQTVELRIGRPEDGSDPTGPFNSEGTVILKPYGQWQDKISKEQLEAIVRDKLTALFPNATINLSQFIQDNLEEVMSGVKGENSVKIFGDDLKELDRAAKEVKAGLEKVPGIEDEGIFRELGQPNLMVDVNRVNASALGLEVADVLDTVSAALGGKVVSQIIDGPRNFSLLVSFPPEYREDPAKIAGIPIVLPSGGVVPLSRIADIHFDTGASFIYRENYRRYIPVKFSVTSNDLSGTVGLAKKEVSAVKIPQGYYMEWSGMFNEMKESFKRFYVSIPLSLFLILTTLFLFYQSVRNVFINMVAPVFAAFAGLLSLLLTGQSLNVASIVGFISIIGVSVLNSSILITHYIGLCRAGMDGNQAIIETAKDKFRPILMCGFVASLGLLPASLSRGVGSQIQKPLAIVVVGGMFVGTIMMLLLMPLLLKSIKVDEK